MGFGAKRTTVFACFKAKKIDYAIVPDTPKSKHLVEVAGPDGQMSTEYIPPELGRRLPQRLAEIYDIPLPWFYNPLLIPGDSDKGKPN
jgi:hypothetical protein